MGSGELWWLSITFAFVPPIFWTDPNYRRKFRSQTSDNMDRWKAEQGRGREKRKIRREKSRRERVRRKKMEMREKVEKSRFTVFPMICGSGGSKSRLAKAAGAEPAGQRRDEKLHAVVARSAFPSQNVQSTPFPDHFWKLRCWKSACRCGAKHISKSKCTKHTMYGPLFEVQMSKSARHCGAKHISKSKCEKQGFGPLLEVQMSLCFASLHYTTLHYTTLHYTPLHYITLHYLPLHSATLNYTTFHYTPQHYTTLHYTTLHWMTLHHR